MAEEGPGRAAARSAGVVPSPNIWNHPEVYERENRALDPEGRVRRALRTVADWDGRRVLDVGCGTGHHLPELASGTASVVGLEPHLPLARSAARRVADLGLAHVSVVAGTAQRLPLADRTVDLVHARWAYFFGPGCEPGLAELDRVVAPGGTALVVDVDATRSTFGAWFRAAWPHHDPLAVARFWRRQGWAEQRLDLRWAFDTRDDLEAAVRIELPPAVADRCLSSHPGTELDTAAVLRYRHYP